MLAAAAAGCTIYDVHMQVWQEAEDARRSKEEAARRVRNRTASFVGADAAGALADAARALGVDASADERQIR